MARASSLVLSYGPSRDPRLDFGLVSNSLANSAQVRVRGHHLRDRGLVVELAEEMIKPKIGNRNGRSNQR